MQTGQEEERGPDHRHQHRLAEVGLEDERHDGEGQEHERQELSRDRSGAGAPAFGEGPGGENDERRLDELRWLKPEDPAPRPFDLGAEHERENDERKRGRKRHQRRAPHMPRRQKRRRDHQRGRRDQHQSLTIDEMEGRKIEPLRDRRACRQRHYEADHHQCNERPDQPPVRGAHPIRDGSALHSRNHALYSPCCARVSARTRPSSHLATQARKASPRASKFANWSNDAQAGDSSTAGSPRRRPRRVLAPPPRSPR